MTMQTFIPARAAPWAFALLDLAEHAVRQCRVLIALALVHLAVALSVAAWFDVPYSSGTVSLLVTMLRHIVPLILVVLLFWRFGYTAVVVRPKRPIAWFIDDMRAICLDPERLAVGVTAFVTISVFAGSFSFLKEMLPQMHAFTWDPALAAADRWLHGSTDPYALLAPLLDTPAVTTALNTVYNCWFFLLYFFVFTVCFDHNNPARRTTFCVAFVMIWAVGGNLLATVLASGGPVYYQAMGHGDTFVPLMDKLHQLDAISPVSALDLQEMLLDGYLNDGPLKGISAMPSMHVTSTTLMTCHAFAWRRWAGWLMVPFTVAILLGSVHLGWHYAIDGYLGILFGLTCWFVARKLVCMGRAGTAAFPFRAGLG